MKILLLSEGRTGSYSIMEWLQESLNLTIVGETDEFDYINNNNFIIKRTLSNENFNLDDVKYFDKIIILYREDTLEQSESSIYAIQKQRWHHDNHEKNNAFYELDETFLINNREEIWKVKYYYDYLNELYKNINVGIKITYEEIFIKKEGQEILENYIDFKSSTSLYIEKNKLRKINPIITINFLRKEVDFLNDEIKKLNDNILQLRKNQTNLIEDIKKLKNKQNLL
jgi:hypothetical protein